VGYLYLCFFKKNWAIHTVYDSCCPVLLKGQSMEGYPGGECINKQKNGRSYQYERTFRLSTNRFPPAARLDSFKKAGF
jgi:hypothetical protein